MQGQRMPVEEPARRCEGAACDRSALEIDGQNGARRDRAEGTQKSDDVLVFEVMQEQRAEDEIVATIRERQQEGIRHEVRRLRQTRMQRVAIQGRDTGAWKAAADRFGHVARTRPDVKDSKSFSRAGELTYQAARQTMPSRPAINRNQVAQTEPRVGFRRVVQIFRLDSARSTSEISFD